MIPPEGRDVQCSNCATTWFQPGRRSDEKQVGADMQPPPAQTPPPTELEVETSAAAEGAGHAATDAADDLSINAADAPAPPAPPQPAAAPARPEIDPAIRDILREEAAREARLRQAEADPVESQPEMPLVPEASAQTAPRMRPDLDAAVDAFDAGKATLGRGVAARDLFPDIDQINSTLRDSADRSAGDADASDIDTLETIPRRRRGVRIGFFLAAALGAGAVALYANADVVAAQLPALAAVTDGYVAAVNGMRFWLDDLAQSLGNTAQ
ncbi:hypothetical protein [Roseicyclus sp.]|uniref:hypothetical protein n=1 Tax=Roseicyclus sp. TaxID=1914329 RepID=UPI003F6C75C1